MLQRSGDLAPSDLGDRQTDAATGSPGKAVGLAGFEPATSCTQSKRASQAALQPVHGASVAGGAANQPTGGGAAAQTQPAGRITQPAQRITDPAGRSRGSRNVARS